MCAALARDQSGAVLVEVAVVMSIMFVVLFGSIEFLFAFYQWNAAAKAVQIGARIAAVSDPVAAGLNELSGAAAGAAVPGDPMPSFVVACDGGTAACHCDGFCTRELTYNTTAMNTIVFGRGSSSCTDASSFYNTGMCDIFSRVTPANVIVTYAQTGLGFAGRPGGPAPTVTVALKGLSLQFFFLSGLLGLNRLSIPPLTTSVTGEDLSSSAPAF